ncbi:MAG: hypothetical protein NVS3B12_08550 [Acidimicrobiales bacterium]
MGLVVIVMVAARGGGGPGFHPVASGVLASTAVLGGATLMLRPEVFRPQFSPGVACLALVILTLTAFEAGPRQAPFVTMFYVWTGSVFLIAPQRRAVIVVIFAGALHAALQIDRDRERLEVATRRRNDFLAGMSHELRTPLNAIIGFADVLGEELFGSLSVGQMSSIAEIRVAGTRLLDLVGEVLAPEAPIPNVRDPEGASLVDRVPILRADPRGAAAFFLLAPLAVVTLPHPRPVGFHFGLVLTIAALGAALDALVLLGPRFPVTLRAASHVAVTTGVATGIAYTAGPQIAPFATMMVLWTATAAVIRLPALRCRWCLSLSSRVSSSTSSGATPEHWSAGR